MSLGGAHRLEDVTSKLFEKLAESMRLPEGRAMARLGDLAAGIEGAIEEAFSFVESGGIACGELGIALSARSVRMREDFRNAWVHKGID